MQLESNEHWEKINSFQLRHRTLRDNFVEIRNGILVWYDTSNTDIVIPVNSFFTIPGATPASANIDAIKGTPNGLSTLDALGKIPLSQLNFDSLVNKTEFGTYQDFLDEFMTTGSSGGSSGGSGSSVDVQAMIDASVGTYTQFLTEFETGLL
ncbi:MAG: hypothetical protein KA146_04590 [Leptospiraceae bacterium]|nr:hypothetical protein [Leptospiraceae bacterium]